MTQDSTHLSYRPSIDGLRAIAILSVLGFHAFPAWVPGGFVGVDVFFVISGFLISGILLDNLQAGSFSLMDFYARRVRRIFPALIVVLATMIVAGFFVLWPDEYRHLGKHIAGGAGFVVNLLLQHESGYFQSSAETQPALHLWSLGVEEQFYIFWPLMLALAWRWKHRAGFMIAAVLVLSFAYSLWLVGHDKVTDFYSPLSRFWELLAGGALAWAARQKLCVPSSRISEVLAAIGLGLIAVADFALDKDMNFPGALALLPVVGAALMIAAGEGAFVNRKLLANRVVVGIGLISYPLYLWHWPLLSFGQIMAGEDLARNARIALVVLSFALAFLTYRFVEQPIRTGVVNKRNILILLGFMGLVGGVGTDIYASGGVPARYGNDPAAQMLDADHLIENWQQNVRIDQCHLQDPDADTQDPSCIEAARPLLLLWGDSHAASLYPGLKNLQASYGFGIAQLTQAGCPPLFDMPKLTFRKNCDAINARILAQAADLKPAVILLNSAWLHKDYPASQNEIIDHLQASVAQIQQTVPQAKIIVVGPMPRWTSPLPALYRRSLTFEHRAPPVRMADHRDIRICALDKAMRARMLDAKIDYLSPHDVLCNKDGCLTRLGDQADSITYVDDEHISSPVSDLVIDRFAPTILDGLGLQQR